MCRRHIRILRFSEVFRLEKLLCDVHATHHSLEIHRGLLSEGVATRCAYDTSHSSDSLRTYLY